MSMNNLALRMVSAAVLAPLAIFAAYRGGWVFVLFWGLAAIAVLWEWTTMAVGPAHRLMFTSCAGAIAISGFLAWLGRPIVAILMVGLGGLAAAIFAPDERRIWVTAGIGYTGALLLPPVFLRADDMFGFAVIVLLFAIVWTTDVFAYFAGRALGGPKLLPVVSPKKTWSGAIVGVVGAVLIALFVASLFGSFNRTAIVVIAFILSVVSQCGDLFRVVGQAAIRREGFEFISFRVMAV